MAALKLKYKDCPTYDEHQVQLQKHSDLQDLIDVHKSDKVLSKQKMDSLAKERDQAVIEHQKAKKEAQNLSIEHNALTEL